MNLAPFLAELEADRGPLGEQNGEQTLRARHGPERQGEGGAKKSRRLENRGFGGNPAKLLAEFCVVQVAEVRMARYRNRYTRSGSIVFPILLIAFGTLFLIAQWRPEFDPFATIWSYRKFWPVILILIGLGKIWDYSRQRSYEAGQGQSPGPGGTAGAPPPSSIGTIVGVIAVVLLLGVLVWRGGTRTGAHGFGVTMRHDVRSVDAQNAKNVRARIDLGAGSLTVSGDAAHLLDANFDYRESNGAPEVDYNVSDGTGELNVSDTDHGPHFLGGDSRNTWNLRFNDEIPLALSVNFGAGEGHLRLGHLNVSKLDMNMGAGRVDVDLTGERKSDLDVDIQGGVGEAVIRVPKSVGVVANASGGIGTVDAHGLRKDGDEYVNEAYGHTPATIHIRVQGGVGRIGLVQEP